VPRSMQQVHYLLNIASFSCQNASKTELKLENENLTILVKFQGESNGRWPSIGIVVFFAVFLLGCIVTVTRTY
jgi:hypothetical protein